MSPICCKPFSRGVKSAHQSVEGARRCELKGCKDFCQRRLGEAMIAEKSDPERANRAQDSSQTDWRRGVGKDNSSFRLYSELAIEVKDVVYASVKSYAVGALETDLRSGCQKSRAVLKGKAAGTSCSGSAPVVETGFASGSVITLPTFDRLGVCDG
jgi:hypothetical protein